MALWLTINGAGPLIGSVRHHHATRDMEAQTVSKRGLLKELGALLLIRVVT